MCIRDSEQHDPNDISKLIEPILQEKADIVIGSRFMAKSKIPKYRKVGLNLLSALIRITSRINISDPLSGFRALHRKAYELITLTENGYGVEAEMLIKAYKCNLKIIEVPTDIKYHTGVKSSKKGPISQAMEIINTILRKTIFTHPLFYLGIPGFIIILIGIVFGTYLVVTYNITQYFSIPISFISLSAVLLGTILLFNAIIIPIEIPNNTFYHMNICLL